MSTHTVEKGGAAASPSSEKKRGTNETFVVVVVVQQNCWRECDFLFLSWTTNSFYATAAAFYCRHHLRLFATNITFPLTIEEKLPIQLG